MQADARTVVIGAGQAGLATSYCLGRLGIEHLVLEASDVPGSEWRDGRWDSFTLVTPNWTLKLPGAEYDGPDPNGFMPRDAIVRTFERYARENRLPVRYGTRVSSVERDEATGAYRVSLENESITAQNVVVATGLYQTQKRPPFFSAIAEKVVQVPSCAYRNPTALPEGAVLVVGSAQSGAQIADELRRAGRHVYLSIGGAGRAPRRYRGRDIVDWMYRMGMFDATVDTLPTPQAKFVPNPHLTGQGGGRSLNLHQFARDGIVLLGHLLDADGKLLRFAPDTKESLAKADAAEAGLVANIDAFIEANGIEAPLETLPHLRDGYDAEEITELDLGAVGVSAVVWATGFAFDFSWVALPVFDADGFPIQERGATLFPGLYFVGLPWLYKRKSGLLMGVAEDAEFVANAIARGDGRD